MGNQCTPACKSAQSRGWDNPKRKDPKELGPPASNVNTSLSSGYSDQNMFEVVDEAQPP